MDAPRAPRRRPHDGGIGTRGPGESQIETDRRLARDRISALRRRLRETKATRATMRRERERAGLPTVALAGYTNAGKSTLLNALTGSEVGVRERLFHTLDPTTRSFEISGRQYLLTDTVGFIRKLPHQLVEAFSATLEEALGADLIVHVVDASVPEEELHEMMAAVDDVLDEIGAGDTPAPARAQQGRPARRRAPPRAVVPLPATRSRCRARRARASTTCARRSRRASSRRCGRWSCSCPTREGGTLSELHDLAGELEREDTAEGVRVQRARAGVGGAALRALLGRTAARASASRPSPCSTPALLARQELREVVLGDARRGRGRPRSRSWAMYRRTSPSSAAQSGAALVGERAAVVADRLLHLLGALAGLTAQAERGIGEVVAGVRVDGGGAGAVLVVGELHARRRYRDRETDGSDRLARAVTPLAVERSPSRWLRAARRRGGARHRDGAAHDRRPQRGDRRAWRRRSSSTSRDVGVHGLHRPRAADERAPRASCASDRASRSSARTARSRASSRSRTWSTASACARTARPRGPPPPSRRGLDLDRVPADT